MTRQIRDILIYNGYEYYLNDEYLEQFFEQFPEKKPVIESSFSALWRGYVATFEIVEEQLFVKRISVFSECNLDEFFPNSRKFDWFTGLIRIDDFRGEYDDENDPSAIFEFLEIVNGNLKNIWKLNYLDFIAFKEIQFDYFKTTQDYANLYLLWRKNNPKIPDSDIDKYISESIMRNSKELF